MGISKSIQRVLYFIFNYLALNFLQRIKINFLEKVQYFYQKKLVTLHSF
ncbi:hypothetical protein HMPREF9071_0330 [Capnocytophaga sp. oral taxon 338 str. F0234]|nr:hypothetical protein HMPREF9071_0330 [Capnocytophaga sp. oral taxon 338 str. F0234]